MKKTLNIYSSAMNCNATCRASQVWRVKRASLLSDGGLVINPLLALKPFDHIKKGPRKAFVYANVFVDSLWNYPRAQRIYKMIAVEYPTEKYV